MSSESNSGSDSAETAEQDLQHRLRLATPEFTTRGFLFTSMLKAVKELGGDDEVVRHCLEASGETSFVEFFHYPTRSLLLLISTAAEALSGRYGSVEEVLRQMGARGGESYMDTPVGRAVQQQTGTRPQRLMFALQTLYEGLTSYGKPALSFPRPDRGVLSVQASFMPLAYHEGGAQAISGRMGLTPVSVRARRTGPLSLDLECSW
ncbi:TIGR02265 family protein [Cystobacter ferrugineus]|uniref:TIGR02265 family protein n=1 Tax=Cystobacter ferrugineus TaxID=83449 RepID=UPI0009FC5075|nr:DUF2378 family protein [Cystobacter ferrugineus]